MLPDLLRCQNTPCTFQSTSHYSLRQHLSRCPHNYRPPSYTTLSATPSIKRRLLHTPTESSSNPENIISSLSSSTPTNSCNQTFHTGNNSVEVAGILHTISKKSGATLINKLISHLNSPSFKREQFLNNIKSAADCRVLLQQNHKSWLQQNGFQHKKMLHTLPDSSTVSSTLYFRNVVNVLKNQLKTVSNHHQIIYRTGRYPDTGSTTARTSHPLHTRYFSDIEGHLRRTVQGCTNASIWWNDNSRNSPVSFGGYLQIFTDKTSSSLKHNSFCAYPVHAVLLNFSREHRLWLVENGYSIVVFLAVSVHYNSNGSSHNL